MAAFHYISPFFIVTSLKASISFYVDKLGFEIRFIGPADDPFFAIVGRDKVSIILKEILPGINATPNHTRHEWASWDAFISVDDPDGLFAEYTADGIAFHQSLRTNEDALRGFEVKDADGYVLYFGRPWP